jgi:hypothetical protein
MHKLSIALAIAAAIAATPARAEVVTTVPQPSKVHFGGTLTALPNDKAILVGGSSSASAEIFDFATNSWTDAKPMSVPRQAHGAARLSDGRVLVVGGLGLDGKTWQKSAEIFDPKTGAWTTVAAPAHGHGGPLVVASTGAVAALAAEDGTISNDLEFYDPIANVWTTRARAIYRHVSYAFAALPDGLLVIGGGDRIERYNSTTDKWSALPFLFPVRTAAASVVMKDGRVLIVGGGELPGGASPSVFDPKTNSLSLVAAGDRRLGGAGAELLSDGRVLLLGASVSTGTPPSVEIFDPTTNGVTKIAEVWLDGMLTAAASDNRVLATSRTSTATVVVTVPRKCTMASECSSGFCVDGYCCDSACKGQCEACDVLNALGTCTAVGGAPHGARTACSPPWTPSCRASACDGYTRDKCVASASTGPCDCSKDSDCESGFCTDGVCCNRRCDGQCEACDFPTTRGSCMPVTGEPRGIRRAARWPAPEFAPCKRATAATPTRAHTSTSPRPTAIRSVAAACSVTATATESAASPMS